MRATVFAIYICMSQVMGLIIDWEENPADKFYIVTQILQIVFSFTAFC